MSLDRVLSLRPTNVVTRLGARSRVPVLNPRDLLAALEGTGATLACFPVYSQAAIPGVLRAARDEDAVIGLACPMPPGDRDAPERFMETVRQATDEVPHRLPLFLQAGPFRVRSADARGVDLLLSAAYRAVEAGFTLLSLDASTLDAADAIGVYRALAQPAAERELALEIAAAVDDLGQLDARRTREVLEALVSEGWMITSLRLGGATYALEPSPRETWQLDSSVLRQAGEAAASVRAALALEDEGSAPETLCPVWLEAGVRKADVHEACARIVHARLLPDRAAQLRDEAAGLGVHPRELLGQVDPARGDRNAQLRIEALTWSLAADLLPRLGARGSARRAVDVLAKGGGY